MKAIETVYNNYRFRSRLEARWAVFFDTLGVKYEYEKEGFDLDEAGWYLPDFWLPQQDYWFEVKGRSNDSGPLMDGYTKAHALCKHTQKRVYLAHGEIQVPRIDNDGAEQSDYHFSDIGEYDPRDLDDESIFPGNPFMTWGQCRECHKVELISYFTQGYHANILSCRCHETWRRFSDEWEQENEETCRQVRAKMGEEKHAYYEAQAKLGLTIYDTPRLIAAYTAARQARFEFGEGTTR